MKYLYAPNSQVSKVESDLKLNVVQAVVKAVGFPKASEIYAKNGIILRNLMF